MQNMKKKPIDNACFFTFFTTSDLIWPKFCPKTTTTLFLFWFQWSMLGDLIKAIYIKSFVHSQLLTSQIFFLIFHMNLDYCLQLKEKSKNNYKNIQMWYIFIFLF